MDACYQRLRVAIACAAGAGLVACPSVTEGLRPEGHTYQCDAGPGPECTESLDPWGGDSRFASEAGHRYQRDQLSAACKSGDAVACRSLTVDSIMRPEGGQRREVLWPAVEAACRADDRNCVLVPMAFESGVADPASAERWADELARKCGTTGRPRNEDVFCEGASKLSLRARFPGDDLGAKLQRLAAQCDEGDKFACTLYARTSGATGDPTLLGRLCADRDADGCVALGRIDPAQAAPQLVKACDKGVVQACLQVQVTDPQRATAQYGKLCERGDFEACGALGVVAPARVAQMYDRHCAKGVERGCERLLWLVNQGQWHPGKGAPSVASRLARLYESNCVARRFQASCQSGLALLPTEPELAPDWALRGRFEATLCSVFSDKKGCSAVARSAPTPMNLTKACSQGDEAMCVRLACVAPAPAPVGSQAPSPTAMTLAGVCQKTGPTNAACFCAMKLGIVPTLDRPLWERLKECADGTAACHGTEGLKEAYAEMTTVYDATYKKLAPTESCTPQEAGENTIIVGAPGKDQTIWTVKHGAVSCGDYHRREAERQALEDAAVVLKSRSKLFCHCPLQP